VGEVTAEVVVAAVPRSQAEVELGEHPKEMVLRTSDRLARSAE
jgi:hypothetical protein